MSEYVPSMNEIRADYMRGHTRHFDEYQVGHSRTVEEELWGEAFDQALTAHDARIASEAAERALREFRAGLGRWFWFQYPYGHLDTTTVSALRWRVEGMLDAEAERIASHRLGEGS